MPKLELVAMAQDRQSALHFGWRPYPHNPRLRQWLHRVRMPSLIVHGDKDGVLAPGYAENLAAALPKATLETIVNAGHYPQIEQCEAVVARIRNFAA
jgi:pimeloyl-ACP methyl ester carboxylesterase